MENLPSVPSAAELGFLKTFRALVDEGALTRTHDSALHLAVRVGEKRACELLVDYGADIVAENDAGETPISLAHSLGLVDIHAYLQQQGEVRPFHACIMGGNRTRPLLLNFLPYRSTPIVSLRYSDFNRLLVMGTLIFVA